MGMPISHRSTPRMGISFPSGDKLPIGQVVPAAERALSGANEIAGQRPCGEEGVASPVVIVVQYAGP